ncbi:Syntaxin 18 [Spironucleus salmonicida]|uniref:Syntaxin 18 n=1 Tax=Spironucleus salmonicida TaxID=348837 RepID=V6LSF3_9EUKA|nr:Syntaxin 18 [Spironucleus salmonicida]|eukprot:EST46641.1 Syntaxin 18 [Spironucleus salmonicida]
MVKTPIQILLDISRQTISDTLLKLKQNEFRFAQKPLNSDSKTYFTKRQAIQFESELMQGLYDVLRRLKSVGFQETEPQTLQEIMARSQVILLQNYWQSAIALVIQECRDAMLIVEKTRPKTHYEYFEPEVLDDYWSQQEQQLTAQSNFSNQLQEYVQARQVQQDIFEIQKIQEVFVENLQSQGDQILRIQDINLQSEETLQQANKYLIRAKKNLEDSTKTTVVLMSIAIAGLWYLDAVRK